MEQYHRFDKDNGVDTKEVPAKTTSQLDFFGFEKGACRLYCSFEALKENNSKPLNAGHCGEKLLDRNNENDNDNNSNGDGIVDRVTLKQIKDVMQTKDQNVFGAADCKEKSEQLDHFKNNVLLSILDGMGQGRGSRYGEGQDASSTKLNFGPYPGAGFGQQDPRPLGPRVFDPIFERTIDVASLSDVELAFYEKYQCDEAMRQKLSIMQSLTEELIADIRARHVQDIKDMQRSQTESKKVDDYLKELETKCKALREANARMRETICVTECNQKMLAAMVGENRVGSSTQQQVMDFVSCLGNKFDNLVAQSNEIIDDLTDQKRLVGFSYIVDTLPDDHVCRTIEAMILENNDLNIRMKSLGRPVS